LPEGQSGLKRFLFVSSVAAAGPSDGPADVVDESRPPRPLTWYGKSKLAAEKALRAVADEGDGQLPLTIVRPAAVYGPRDKDFRAYFSPDQAAPERATGAGERHVSLIYVRDLVDLLVRALEQEEAVGQTYFGCGRRLHMAGWPRRLPRHWTSEWCGSQSRWRRWGCWRLYPRCRGG